MKILLIGDADSSWLKEYVDRVLADIDYDVKIVSYFNTVYEEEYKSKGIEVYSYATNNRLCNHFKRIIISKDIAKKIGEVDIVHVQYFERALVRLNWRFLLQGKKKIMTLWGSDLLRVSKYILLFNKIVFDKIDEITVMNANMKGVIGKVFGDEIYQKTSVLDFGNPLYDTLDEVINSNSKKQCKQYWGIDENKWVIAVGYNAIREQQHLEMIEQILKLPTKVLEQVIVVLHFAYGKYSIEYLEIIKNKLLSGGIQFVLIDKFLDKREMAILRYAVDIFLYGQTTDALSGSVLEYVYAGAILIKPNWLDYTELYKRNIKYIEYNEFGEIPCLLQEVLNNISDMKRENKGNREQLRRMNSWEVLVPQWKEKYSLGDSNERE